MKNRPNGGDGGAVAMDSSEALGHSNSTSTAPAPQRIRDLTPIGTAAGSRSAPSAESPSLAIAAIWRGGEPLAESWADSVYLASRGLTAASLGPFVRFHRTLRLDDRTLPGLLAAVTRADSERPNAIVAILRTFIDPKTGKRTDRRMLGPCAGGAVKLGRGDGPLVLGEGIETVASFAKMRGLTRAWSCLSASGLAAVALPPIEIVRDIIITADCDAAGLAAAAKLAERAEAEGRKVYLEVPRHWRDDFNDVLRAGGSE